MPCAISRARSNSLAADPNGRPAAASRHRNPGAPSKSGAMRAVNSLADAPSNVSPGSLPPTGIAQESMEDARRDRAPIVGRRANIVDRLDLGSERLGREVD